MPELGPENLGARYLARSRLAAASPDAHPRKNCLTADFHAWNPRSNHFSTRVPRRRPPYPVRHPAVGQSHRRRFIANQVSRTDILAVNSSIAGYNKRVKSSDFSCSVIHRRGCYRWSLFLGFLSYDTFGGKEKAGDRCRVLKSASHHLGGVDDSGLHQVFELLLCCVESKCALVAPDLVDHHRTVLPGILCDPACWFIKGFPNNVDAEPFLFAGTQLVQRRR